QKLLFRQGLAAPNLRRWSAPNCPRSEALCEQVPDSSTKEFLFFPPHGQTPTPFLLATCRGRNFKGFSPAARGSILHAGTSKPASIPSRRRVRYKGRVLIAP